MAAWQPNPQLLEQVARMMQCSLAPDTALQRQAYTALEEHGKNPEFVRYLAFIFARGSELGPAARAVAGLTLKRCIDTTYAALPQDVRASVRAEVLRTLGDGDAGIRHAAANAVSTIVRDADLAAWPELPGALDAMIDAATPDAAEGALTALAQIAEDVGGQLDSAALGHPLATLVPKLVAWMRHPSMGLRRLAASAMASLLYTRARAVEEALDAYMAALAALTADTSPEVRRVVSESLGTLVESFADRLWPHLQPILRFQLACTLDADSGVAMAACSFWQLLLELIADAESEAADDAEEGAGDIAAARAEALEPCLGPLVSALLTRMVMLDDDDEDAGGGGAGGGAGGGDAGVADRPEDVRPHIFRNKAAAGGHGGGAAAASGAGVGNGTADGSAARVGSGDDDDDDEEGGGGGDDDDDDTHGEVAQWTVRRAAAKALDDAALVFGERLLPTLLPELNARFSRGGDDDPAWRAREVGLLALGAVVDGCGDALLPYLPALFPFVLRLTADRRPLVRAMALWCAAQYTPWALEDAAAAAPAGGGASAPGGGGQLAPLVAAVVPRLLDSHKRVQGAACDALQGVASAAGELLAPHLPQLAAALVAALRSYQARNRSRLYDAIGALAENAGAEALCASPDVCAALVPAVMQRAAAVGDGDPELGPLLESVTALVTVLGPRMAEHARGLFTRALRLMEHVIVLELAARASGDAAPTPDLLVASLDLLGGLAEGFQTAFAELARGSPLVPLLLEAVRSSHAGVRQAAFALAGELAKFAFAELAPHVPALLPAAIACMRDTRHNADACNNAVWATGEIALRAGPAVAAIAPQILERLGPIINSGAIGRSLLENSAICLGRLGLAAPELMAPSLRTYLRAWLRAVPAIGVDAEREQTFAGLCRVLAANPAAGAEQLGPLCAAFACADGVAPPVLQVMLSVLGGYRGGVPPELWAAHVARLSPELRAQLARVFGAGVV